MQPTLLVLAAGMGSRYGGLKQLDPMGPNGETILDYSVRDAIRAGFGKVVFVIRRDFADAFRSAIGERFIGRIAVDDAFQELDDLPDGFGVPDGRVKPWGTAHAVRAARGKINEPFAVINADDFYGAEAYQQIADHLQSLQPGQLSCCLAGYRLVNTLSEHGAVNRGLCTVEGGKLQGISEHMDISREGDGHVRGTTPSGTRIELSPEATVSMNLWGFTPELFKELEGAFTAFLEARIAEPKSECYLPAVVDDLLKANRTACTVLETTSNWFGVTYPEDKPIVQAALARMEKGG